MPLDTYIRTHLLVALGPPVVSAARSTLCTHIWQLWIVSERVARAKLASLRKTEGEAVRRLSFQIEKERSHRRLVPAFTSHSLFESDSSSRRVLSSVGAKDLGKMSEEPYADE